MSSEATEGQTPDLYGQLHPVETPELIQRKLAELILEIDKLPDKDKEDLIKAQKNCPELLTDEFKLMFLRCEVYNADLAAKRYCSYWTKRIETFGEIKAFQPLNLSTLEDDRIALERGFIRVVELNDKRNYLFLDPSKQDKKLYTTDSMARAVWYVIHACLEDVEVQKKGLIMLAYPHNAKFQQFNKELAKKILGSLQGNLPVRLSALHICHPPSFFRLIWAFIHIFMSNRLKKRVQVQGGSREHVLHRFETLYNLSKSDLPTDIGGNIVLDHNAWLEQRAKDGK